MDEDDRRTYRFMEFVAARLGTRDWFILEPGAWKDAVTKPGKAITRKEFEKLRRLFEAQHADA